MSFQKVVDEYTKKDFTVEKKRTTKLAQWYYLVSKGGLFHTDGVFLYFVDGDVKIAHMNDFVKRLIAYYDNGDLDYRDQAILIHSGELNSREFRKLAKRSMIDDAYKIIKIKKIKSDIPKDAPKKSVSDKKVRRKRLAKAQKNLILRSQHHKCALCQTDISKLPVHYDHRIPLAIGGSDEIENIQALCPNCHALKSQRDSLAISRAKKNK